MPKEIYSRKKATPSDSDAVLALRNLEECQAACLENDNAVEAIIVDVDKYNRLVQQKRYVLRCQRRLLDAQLENAQELVNLVKQLENAQEPVKQL